MRWASSELDAAPNAATPPPPEKPEIEWEFRSTARGVEEELADDLRSVSPVFLGEDAGGPRIDPASVVMEGEEVTFTASARLSKASVAPRAFSVSAYDIRDGWHTVEVRAALLDRLGRRVRLELATGFGGNLVRVIARGTGPSPLLGTGLVPLAGAVGGPAGGPDDGNDFVIMVKRSET